MKQIKVEQDVFDDLLSEVIASGKSFSEVVREARGCVQRRNGSSGEDTPSSTSVAESPETRLRAFLRSPRFLAKRKAIDRFLDILSFAHDENPGAFSKVEEVTGRSRKYFSRDRTELVQSGVSVYPKRIPDTDFWAMSNASNDQKRTILRDALRVLGYDDQVAMEAADSL